MKYTVIVPVYNGEDVIETCLESITNQEDAALGIDYSVLVIDDGSTDRTAEIARRFPVEVVSLGENRGRVIARVTGACKAPTERLVFVDVRASVSSGLIASLPQFDSHKAVIAPPETKESGLSFLERILFLIRRKYYGPKNYPVQEKEFAITPENFKRSPKGTTLLVIDRELFLRCTPESTGEDKKESSDDTLLFHNLVFREGLEVLRSPRIKLFYTPRTRLIPFMKWLNERGMKFASFYLTKGGYFYNYFRLLLGLALVSLATLVLLPVHFFLILLWAVLGGYLALCVYLSENLQDFVILFFGFPAILIPFGAGILRVWIKSLLK